MVQMPTLGLLAMISRYHIGGVIFFARNIQSPRQVAALTNELQQTAIESGNPGLFIAIDQEGGRVARLTEDTGFTEFPSAMAIGATADPENAYRMASAMAAEMRAVGINIDFAPDPDVNNNPANPVIGTRSFSSDPNKWLLLASRLRAVCRRMAFSPLANTFPAMEIQEPIRILPCRSFPMIVLGWIKLSLFRSKLPLLKILQESCRHMLPFPH